MGAEQEATAFSALSDDSSPQLTQLSIPDELMQLLDAGVVLPVLIRNTDPLAQANPVSAVADLEIIRRNGRLMVGSLSMSTGVTAGTDTIRLSAEAHRRLADAQDQALDEHGFLALGEEMQLRVDWMTMRAELWVPPSMFGVTHAGTETAFLGTSSVPRLSDLLRYNINSYWQRGESANSQNSTINFDNITSLRENHFNLSGTTYNSSGGIATENQFVLSQAMFERDMAGRRVAAGMLDGWSMQSIASVTTLDTQRMYAMSYGNAGLSSKHDTTQSLTPIEVYLPSNGEARLFRDGRLLSVQRFTMGNHQFDTSSLPAGIYNVEVEISVGGQIISRRPYRVNKPYGQNVPGEDLSWQLWGGASKRSPYYGQFNQPDVDASYQPLAGLSLASRWSNMHWNASIYKNGRTWVQEGNGQWQRWNWLSLQVQNLLASDGTRRRIGTLNFNLPKGWGGVWLTNERGHKGQTLSNTFVQSRASMGLNLNLQQWIPGGGSLSLNQDRQRGSNAATYRSASYTHTVYSGRYGSAMLQLGANRSRGGTGGASTAYYGMLNVQLPFDNLFSMGISHQSGSNNLDLGLAHDFGNDRFVNYAGANISRQIGTSAAGGGNTYYSGNVNYQGRYGRGMVMADASSASRSLAINQQGSVAWGDSALSVGLDGGEAGVVIQIPSGIPAGQLEAVINKQNYPLHAGRNLVSVPAYANYQVDVRSAANATQSYDIRWRENAEFTLYPGNIVSIQPEVRRMVTVIGRLIDGSGQGISQAQIRNHIGFSQTDHDGNFAIDVDANVPQIIIEPAAGGQREITLPLDSASGEIEQLGEMVWEKGNRVSLHMPSQRKGPGTPSEEVRLILGQPARRGETDEAVEAEQEATHTSVRTPNADEGVDRLNERSLGDIRH